MVGGTKDWNQMSWVWILPSSIARLTSSDLPPSAMKIISPKSLRCAWQTVQRCRISVFSLFLFGSSRIWKALPIGGLSPLNSKDGIRYHSLQCYLIKKKKIQPIKLNPALKRGGVGSRQATGLQASTMEMPQQHNHLLRFSSSKWAVNTDIWNKGNLGFLWKNGNALSQSIILNYADCQSNLQVWTCLIG